MNRGIDSPKICVRVHCQLTLQPYRVNKLPLANRKNPSKIEAFRSTYEFIDPFYRPFGPSWVTLRLTKNLTKIPKNEACETRHPTPCNTQYVELRRNMNPPTQLIENRSFENDNGVAILLEGKSNITIRNCRFKNVGVPIRLKQCSNIIVESCRMESIGIQGIDVRDGCQDIRILNNQMNQFKEDAQGGHFISTEKTDQPRQRRITVAGNTLIANGKSWVRGRKNGASGDMLSMRSVAGFTMRGNTLIGGGEFGMTCLQGCKNGIIAENTIRNTDGTGLLVAYEVENINVHGNNIIDTGCSFESDGSKNDITNQAGIFCRGGVKNVLIVGNLICREKASEMRYGIQLRETSGVIAGNLIAGVDKKIHIAEKLKHTVDVEFSSLRPK